MARRVAVLVLAVSCAPACCALVKPLRAAEIKRRLHRFGVSTHGLFEKPELLELLRQAAPEALGPGHPVPLEAVSAARGAMGSGIAVDSKSYYALRLGLSAAHASPDVLWVIDSAASHSLISPSASSALGVRPTGVTATADSATSIGAAGYSQVDCGSVTLAGGLDCGALRPVVMDLPLPGECGLLGLDFLSKFDIDLRLRSLNPLAIFHPAGEVPQEALDGLVQLKCRRLAGSGLLATRVAVGAAGGASASVDAVVDLGSSMSGLNSRAATAAGLGSAGDPRVQLTDTVIAGATGEPVRLSEAELAVGLGAGGEDGRRAVTGFIADLPIFPAIFGAEQPAMILGLDALAPDAHAGTATSRVVLSASTGAVWVEP